MIGTNIGRNPDANKFGGKDARRMKNPFDLLRGQGGSGLN
jgi:hypothetical protein